MSDWEKAKEAALIALAAMNSESDLFINGDLAHRKGKCPDCDYKRGRYEESLHAVLDTLKAHGYVVVPETLPTNVLKSVKWHFDNGVTSGQEVQVKHIWRAMITAARKEMEG